MDRLSTLLQSPPPSVMWLAVGISFVSVALQILLAIAKAYGYRISRQDRKRDSELKIAEKWFETVIIDRVLPRVLEFVDSERSIFAPPKSGTYRDLNDAFAQRAEALKGSLAVVSVLSIPAHRDLLEAIDRLADTMTKHCAGNDGYSSHYAKYGSPDAVTTAFDDCQGESLRIMRLMHTASLKPPASWLKNFFHGPFK